ncbi:hypothetical protein [Spongiimicrobium sp. 2-473A-2-J]|uniref:hypothetical protein n=1 Tax=Eudoraea algarum TaxID=3417568 RepID=UPI003D36B6A3
MRKCVHVLWIGLVLLGCGGGDDAPKLPQAAVLEFPLQNSECTTGVSLDETTSQVEFRWQAGANAEGYELRATNLNTNVLQTISTLSLSAQLPLEKGAPYSWLVISKQSNTSATATSSTWQFYNAGSQTTYAPFRADIIAPQSGASILRDINNEVSLNWTGADVDNDIEGYEVYLSTSTPPETLVATPSAFTTNIKVSIAAGSVYYWQVITTDSEGNSSDSGIFDFRVN